MSVPGVFLQGETLLMLRLLKLAALHPPAADDDSAAVEAASGGDPVQQWVHDHDWRTPHRLLEDQDEYTGAATLRRLGGRGELSSEHWRLAADLTSPRGATQTAS